jgi:hypothetical protein
MRYEELRRALRSRNDLEPGTPASPAEIDAVVAQLGDLPPDYRAFLGEFGWVSFGAYEIFGTGTGVPPYLDVVHMTESERDEGGLGSGLVAIMNDGGGNLACIDCRSAASEFRIVLWLHETSHRDGPSAQAATFSEFLAGKLNE